MSCGQNRTHAIFSENSARNHVSMVALTLYLGAYSKKTDSKLTTNKENN